MKIILTGATGTVGEGVLFACIESPEVSEVFCVSRSHYDTSHPKLKQLLVSDFLEIEDFKNQLSDCDACFWCAGISSVGMSEAVYTRITYETTIHAAKILKEQNPNMVFNFVSGASTDSSEKGKSMWARVKGKTENELMTIW